MLAGVDDAGADGGLVALAQESRYVGLHHQVLLSHGLARQHAVAEVRRVGQAHEAPCRQALGQGELQRHRARCVGRQLWVEERRLLQVLAQLHLGRLFVIVFFGVSVVLLHLSARLLG